MNILLLLGDDSVPIYFVKFLFREIIGNRLQIQCLIPQIQQLPFDQFQRKGMIVFFKYFLLNNPILSLKGIEQVKGNRSVGIVIPYLHQIYSCSIVKEGIIQVKSLFFLLNFLFCKCIVYLSMIELFQQHNLISICIEHFSI